MGSPVFAFQAIQAALGRSVTAQAKTHHHTVPKAFLAHAQPRLKTHSRRGERSPAIPSYPPSSQPPVVDAGYSATAHASLRSARFPHTKEQSTDLPATITIHRDVSTTAAIPAVSKSDQSFSYGLNPKHFFTQWGGQCRLSRLHQDCTRAPD